MRRTDPDSFILREKIFGCRVMLINSRGFTSSRALMNTHPTTHAVTRLLVAWKGGDAGASDQLMPLVYDELRHLARSYLRRERTDHTLQPTALVHEAYLRLVDTTQVDWQSRAHFFGIAARVMRRVLVDHARSRAAGRRGGGAVKISLDEAGDLLRDEGRGLLALDEALAGLAELYPRPSRVVELRFFGGLTTPEIAGALGVSDSTVERDWHFALLWLKREMTTDEDAAHP